ncbi:hypothetical protein diail_247 [Diaporthe ilicicola]|nr:hypothetical protein diail_247 [Diaporthe ilicicola]
MATPANSQRELRPIRRSNGRPVTSVTSYKELDFDEDEVSNYNPESTSESDGEEAAPDEHQVNAGTNTPHVANTRSESNESNVILLPDSKFNADRTKVRFWHELRYVRTKWSLQEEEQLRVDCLAITDDCDLYENSNALLWTACFDRYGVPLGDIFTYGLRPHPDYLRQPRQKLLSPIFCDHLIDILIHPIFQGNTGLLCYILQRVVCMRTDMHYPPMGTMPYMDDAKLGKVDLLASILLSERTAEDRQVTHADAYLFLSHPEGPMFHAAIQELEDLLCTEFANKKCRATAPRDNIPHSRSLFFVQLWDLQFLSSVLDKLSLKHEDSYVSVEKYKSTWLMNIDRIQKYVVGKLDSLVQQWFLSDERNFRIRSKLRNDPNQHLYDIPEEDFIPAWALSQWLTAGAKAILEGDYLKAICPPDQERSMERDEVCESDSDSDTLQLQASPSRLSQDIPVQSIEEEDASPGIRDATSDDHQGAPSHKRKFETSSDSDDDEAPPPSRLASIISIQSIRSSDSDSEEYREDSPLNPGQEIMAWRFMRRPDHNP